MLFGALLEMILIVANLGTALVLFPILKRQNEPLALGYVAARTIESVFIAVGIVSLLSIVTLHQGAGARDLAGADRQDARRAARLDVPARPRVRRRHRERLILGYLMYRSGLVPRGLAVLGMVGGALLLASGIAVLLGVFDKGSSAQAIATAPEFVWELSLGIYLMVKGFKPSPIIETDPPSAAAVGRGGSRLASRRDEPPSTNYREGGGLPQVTEPC